MELRVLEYFLRVAELGSINRAAKELHISQPSLSRWIALLEREMGTPLLVRTRQGIQVTEAGHLMIANLGPVIRQLYTLVGNVRAKGSGRISLAMPISMQKLITVPFVTKLWSSSEIVEIRVYEGINSMLRQWMEAGHVDVGIIALSERVPERYETLPLVREQLFLVGARQAKLRLDTPVAVSRLTNLDLIQPGRPNVIRNLIEREMLRQGQVYRSKMDAETLALCLELTKHGLGYTVAPYCALSDYLGKSSGITAAPIRGLSLVWALQINRARSHMIAIKNVSEWLVEFVSTTIRSGKWPFAEIIDQSEPPAPSARADPQ